MKDGKEMTEMAEMNKAFDDFDKACQKAIGACQDFIQMDIKIMRTLRTEQSITFVPPVGDDGTSKPKHGWLNIDGKIHCITGIHSFDDFGVEQDTLTLDDGSEWITQDGGSTFTSDIE